MSDTIKGKLEEIIIAKTGKGKKGPWTLYAIVVDGTRYGAGFDKPKAAVGSIVEFEVEENEAGYTDMVKGTFTVVKAATSAESAATSKANGESAAGKQTSIETQSSIASAALIVAAQINAGVNLADPGQAVAALVRFWTNNLLHPTSPALKASPKKPAKTESEDEDQSGDDSDLPY